MQRINWITVLSALIITAGGCVSAEECQEAEAGCQECPCEKAEGAYRFDAGYTFGKYAGFDKNYSEIGVFLAPAVWHNQIAFVDARGYWIQKHKRAYGVGAGTRLWSARSDRAYGVNLFYNYQETHSHHFQKVGLGVESLGEFCDLRANGYAIVNGNVKKGKLHTFDFPGGFIETVQKRQQAFSGADAEVGYHFFRCRGYEIYAAAGGYYYRSCGDHFCGGQARLKLSWRGFLNFEGRYSHDSMYDGQAQARIWLSIPLDTLFSCCRHGCCLKSLIVTQPVVRNPMITTHHCIDERGNWE